MSLRCGKEASGGQCAPAAMTGLGAVARPWGGVPISIAIAAQPVSPIKTAEMDFTIPQSEPWGLI